MREELPLVGVQLDELLILLPQPVGDLRLCVGNLLLNDDQRSIRDG